MPPRDTASVPVHAGVRVNAPAEFVTLRRMLVSLDVARVSAPVCVVPYVCARERTPVLVTLPAEYVRPDENVVLETHAGIPFA